MLVDVCVRVSVSDGCKSDSLLGDKEEKEVITSERVDWFPYIRFKISVVSPTLSYMRVGKSLLDA